MNFIRVGNQAINLDFVSNVVWNETSVTVFFGDTVKADHAPFVKKPGAKYLIQFDGDEAKAVKNYFLNIQELKG